MSLISTCALLSAAAWTTYAHVVPDNLMNRTGDLAVANITLSPMDTHIVLSDRQHKVSHADIFDRHGMERALYHVTHYMAQRGRDRVLHQYPEFHEVCLQDPDCILSLDGLLDSITADVVSRKPAQHGAGFGPEDFLDHASWRGPQAELDSAIQTLMIKEVYQPQPELSRLHGTITEDHDLSIWLRILHKQSRDGDQSRPDVGNIKKALERVREERPTSIPLSVDKLVQDAGDVDDTDDLGPAATGTLFLRSIMKYGVCMGDEYLCNHYSDTEHSVMSLVLDLLRITTMDHVLDKHNYLRIALTELSNQPVAKDRKMRYPYKVLDKGHKKQMQGAIKAAVKEALSNHDARKFVVQDLRQQVEVFDAISGRLWPGTVLPAFGKDPQLKVSAIGYERFFTQSEGDDGTSSFLHSRRLKDIRPVLGGKWMMIPSGDSDVGRPATNKTVIPSEDIRIFQTMQNPKGDVAVDSMGQPKLRSISLVPGKAKMLSVGSVSIRDQAISQQRLAIRLFNPDGTLVRGPDGRFLAFEFIPGKHPDVNGLSIMRQDVDWPEDDAPARELVARVRGHDPDILYNINDIDSTSREFNFYKAPLNVRLDAMWNFAKEWLRGRTGRGKGPRKGLRALKTEYKNWKKMYESMHKQRGMAFPKTSYMQSTQGSLVAEGGVTVNVAPGKTPKHVRWTDGWTDNDNLESRWNAAEEAVKPPPRSREPKVRKGAGSGLDEPSDGESRQPSGNEPKDPSGSDSGESSGSNSGDSPSSGAGEPSGSESGESSGSGSHEPPNGYRRPTVESVDEGRRDRGFVVDGEEDHVTPADIEFWNSGRLMSDPVCKLRVGGPGLMKRGACTPNVERGAPRFGVNAAGEAAPVGADGAAIGEDVAIAGESGVRVGLQVAGKVLGAVGAIGVLVPIAMEVFDVIEAFTPDRSCPMGPRYTELWNDKIAADTVLHAPCETTTTAMYSALATTPTTAASVVTLTDLPSSMVSGAQVTTSTSIPSTTKVIGGPYRNSTTAGTLTTVTLNNATVVGTMLKANSTASNPLISLTPTMTTTTKTASATSSPTSTDLPPCHDYQIDPNEAEYRMVYMRGLRCPVPLAYECTIDWYHEHVNQLPAGQRNPNYCTNGDVTGHFKAKEMGCLDKGFRSKECKKEFGLRKLSYEDWTRMREDLPIDGDA